MSSVHGHGQDKILEVFYVVYLYMIMILMSLLKRAFCCHSWPGLCNS
jgi:hypothetical protein